MSLLKIKGLGFIKENFALDIVRQLSKVVRKKMKISLSADLSAYAAKFETLRKTNKEIPAQWKDVLLELGKFDSTPNKSFLDWMCRVLVSGNSNWEDLTRLQVHGTDKLYLSLFEANKHKLPREQRDIGSYPSFSSLIVTIDKLLGIGGSPATFDANFDVYSTGDNGFIMFEDNAFRIVQVLSYKSSCYWSKLFAADRGSWCTGWPNTRRYYDEHAGNLVVIIDKIGLLNTNNGQPDKWQISTHDGQFKDRNDVEVNQSFFEASKPFMHAIKSAVLQDGTLYTDKIYDFGNILHLRDAKDIAAVNSGDYSKVLNLSQQSKKIAQSYHTLSKFEQAILALVLSDDGCTLSALDMTKATLSGNFEDFVTQLFLDSNKSKSLPLIEKLLSYDAFDKTNDILLDMFGNNVLLATLLRVYREKYNIFNLGIAALQRKLDVGFVNALYKSGSLFPTIAKMTKPSLDAFCNHIFSVDAKRFSFHPDFLLYETVNAVYNAPDAFTHIADDGQVSSHDCNYFLLVCLQNERVINLPLNYANLSSTI